MSISSLIILLILLPIVSAFSVIFVKKQSIRDFLLIFLSMLGIAVCASIIFLYLQNGIFVATFKYWKFTHNIYFALQIEPISLGFASLISILWPLTLIYTINYMKTYENNDNVLNLKTFYVFLCLSIAATLSIAFSGNLITTFIFYECLTLLTYPLIIFDKTEKAKKAGRKYLSILLGTSTALFFPAIILVYLYTGSTDYILKGLFFSSSNIVTAIIFLMFLFGVSKAALVPFHSWLPAAMIAPSPVSALLHAVAVVKSGAFILIKITIYIFGINCLSDLGQTTLGCNYFIIIPAITILVASTINLFQNNFKRLLAYSTISNLSYIICCVLLFNTLGIIAASAWFISHALAKIVLFFQAGCYIKFTKKETITDLSGVGTFNNLPIVTSIGSFSMLSILGLPFTVGFIGKFFLVKSILFSEAYLILVIIIISYVFTVIFFSRSLYHFYFAYPTNSVDNLVNVNCIYDKSLIYMTFSMLIIAMLNILLFFTYDHIIQILKTITLEIN